MTVFIATSFNILFASAGSCHSKEGESLCKKKGCKHNNGDRIGVWAGEKAQNCKHFKLNSWYEDDRNFD